jgi:hypothetical protein
VKVHFSFVLGCHLDLRVVFWSWRCAIISARYCVTPSKCRRRCVMVDDYQCQVFHANKAYRPLGDCPIMLLFADWPIQGHPQPSEDAARAWCRQPEICRDGPNCLCRSTPCSQTCFTTCLLSFHSSKILRRTGVSQHAIILPFPAAWQYI